MSAAGDRVLGASDMALVKRSICVEGAVAKVQVSARGIDDEHQHWQPYGFGSAPLEGAQAIRLAIGSHREEMLAVMVDDRRYRPALAAGESAIFDDQGQAVAVRRARIEIGTIGAGMRKLALDSDPVTTATDWASWFATVGGVVKTAPPATPIGNIAASAKAVAE